MKLVIANKNYSSWSLRAWLLLAHLELPFVEQKWSFNDPEWRDGVRAVSPAGRVPVLIDGTTVVWDSLSIAEYVHDRFPTLGVWPSDPAARALARSLCAEMHAGFAALRTHMPMNIEARLPGQGFTDATKRDIARVLEAWDDARTRFGRTGPFLFGSFSAADAFFAPVVWRFVTHDVPLGPVGTAYSEALRALPAMRAWEAEALGEHDFVPEDEPYREPIS